MRVRNITLVSHDTHLPLPKNYLISMLPPEACPPWSLGGVRIFAILTLSALQVMAPHLNTGLAPWGLVEAHQILPRAQASPRYDRNLHLSMVLK